MNIQMEKRKTYKTSVIILTVTVLYILYHYQGSASFFLKYINRRPGFLNALTDAYYYQWIMAFFIMGIIPCLFIKIAFREELKNYGVAVKKPIILLFITILGIAVATPFAFFGAKNPGITSVYPLIRNLGDSPLLFLKSSLIYFLYYAGYEICFRGFLFMGIKDDVGEWKAVFISLAMTTLLHIDRPQEETLMALVAGFVFPVVVLRTGSLLPVILIHAYVGISLDYWIIINQGGF